MRDARHVRAVIAGLLGFASAEEEMLASGSGSGSGGPDGGAGGGAGGGPGGGAGGGPDGPDRWGAVPLLAHITEFKAQQSERIEATLSRRTPPAFADIDHSSAAVYAAYASRAARDVVAESRRVTAGLLDGVRGLADEDLLDPSRHSWLRGRPLWLQVIVRGFWHPTGHIADYYLRHGPDVRVNAGRDPDLDVLRVDGRLGAILAAGKAGGAG